VSITIHIITQRRRVSSMSTYRQPVIKFTHSTQRHYFKTRPVHKRAIQEYSALFGSYVGLQNDKPRYTGSAFLITSKAEIEKLRIILHLKSTQSRA